MAGTARHGSSVGQAWQTCHFLPPAQAHARAHGRGCTQARDGSQKPRRKPFTNIAGKGEPVCTFANMCIYTYAHIRIYTHKMALLTVFLGENADYQFIDKVKHYSFLNKYAKIYEKV